MQAGKHLPRCHVAHARAQVTGKSVAAGAPCALEESKHSAPVTADTQPRALSTRQTEALTLRTGSRPDTTHCVAACVQRAWSSPLNSKSKIKNAGGTGRNQTTTHFGGALRQPGPGVGGAEKCGPARARRPQPASRVSCKTLVYTATAPRAFRAWGTQKNFCEGSSFDGRAAFAQPMRRASCAWDGTPLNCWCCPRRCAKLQATQNSPCQQSAACVCSARPEQRIIRAMGHAARCRRERPSSSAGAALQALKEGRRRLVPQWQQCAAVPAARHQHFHFVSAAGMAAYRSVLLAQHFMLARRQESFVMACESYLTRSAARRHRARPPGSQAAPLARPDVRSGAVRAARAARDQAALAQRQRVVGHALAVGLLAARPCSTHRACA